MKYERVRNCEICGETFIAYHSKTKYCCEECRKQAYSLSSKNREAKLRRENGRKSNIDQINREAQAAGMSYGQYVAKKYMREVLKW